MSSNESIDREMERTLRDYYAARSRELEAPADTWARLERRLDRPRLGWLGGNVWKILTAGAGTVAAAVLVIVVINAVGISPTAEFEAHATPTPVDVSAVVSQVMQAQRPGVTTEDVAQAVQSALAQQEGVTSADVANEISKALSAQPGVTSEEVASAIAGALDERPGLTTQDVANEIGKALRAQPGVTEDQVAAATQAALAERPGITEEQVAETVAKALAELQPAVVAAAAQAAPESSAPTAAPAQPYATPAPTAAQAAAEPALRQPGATTFADFARQPAVIAAEDAVSTFSLDVDRTSYFLALNWMGAGYVVEPDSVRAEEWLNAFDYGYQPPSDEWGFGVETDLVEHPLDPGKLLARIGFQAPHMPDDRPLNVTLVLDASGSMANGNRVAIARAAAEAIHRSLRPQDRIAVVHFTTDVVGHLTVPHVSPDFGGVSASIANLMPRESTNVQAGLNEGVRLADQARRERPDAYNYVILMSDGVANVDATDPFGILESAYDRDAANPLRLITIGVGIENYNDYLLEQLAQHGNGWYRYLDTVDQARATFSRENWLALSTPFADQTRAQVTWDPALVYSWRIVGYENRVTPDETFAEDRKEFAEIYSGAATTVLYELELRSDARLPHGEKVDLGRVELRWIVPDTQQSRSQRADVTGRGDVSFDYGADPMLRLAAIVGLAADRYSALPQAPAEGHHAIRDDLDRLREHLAALRADLGHLDSYHDFAYLLERITEGVQARPSRSSGYSN